MQDPLVQTTLNLWSASRLLEETWRVEGPNPFGRSAPLDQSSPWYGIIPVIPMMDHQLGETVTMSVLVPFNYDIIHSLEYRFKYEETAKKEWFSIFLATAILLSNVEHQIAHDHRFARRYDLPVNIPLPEMNIAEGLTPF